MSDNSAPLTTQDKEPSFLARMQKKFTVPPPPKTIAEGVKRDYLLVGGICATVAFLSAGVVNHVRGGSSVTTSKFLKGRIWAQAITVGAMGVYAFSYQKSVEDEEESRKKQKVILT
eukprot:gene3709-4273_t